MVYEEEDSETIELATALLCDVDAASEAKLSISSGYALGASADGENDSFVGVALDGVQFEHPFRFSYRWQRDYYEDGLDYDEFAEDFVAEWNTKMDLCLTYVNDDNGLAYSSLPPCVKSF